MKRKLLQIMGQAAFAVLRKVDYYITGSNSGFTREEEVEDPYRTLKVLRDRGSILRTYTNRGWMVLGFEEAQALFKDQRFGSDIRKNKFLSSMLRFASDGRSVMFLDNPTLLNLDPPDHTRLRKLVAQGFLHKFVLSMEPRIASIVRQCLDEYDPASGQFDIVRQLAKPLPAIVIAELLGLPESDLPRFQKLSEELLGLTAIGNDEEMKLGAIANEELVNYFKEIIGLKRENPDQALISRLIQAEEEGDRLTADELYSTCGLLLVAGHETTTRLIGNGLYVLLNHPDQLKKLLDNPSLTPNAIEEILRYEPPVQLMPRFALEDAEFFGKKIKKNQLIVPMIASANRDPAANDNPDDFDISRENIKNVSFGHGIHLCLGLTLARLEGRIAINILLERFPDMTLADQKIVWTPLPLVRGMDNLVIKTNESPAKIDQARLERARPQLEG